MIPFQKMVGNLIYHKKPPDISIHPYVKKSLWFLVNVCKQYTTHSFMQSKPKWTRCEQAVSVVV